MRDLNFWLERYQLADYKVYQCIIGMRQLKRIVGVYQGLKLKTQYGCRLSSQNRVWVKVKRRRAGWLRNRLGVLTELAKYRSEKKRIERTKLPFLARKIRELGGKVPASHGSSKSFE